VSSERRVEKASPEAQPVSLDYNSSKDFSCARTRVVKFVNAQRGRLATGRRRSARCRSRWGWHRGRAPPSIARRPERSTRVTPWSRWAAAISSASCDPKMRAIGFSGATTDTLHSANLAPLQRGTSRIGQIDNPGAQKCDLPTLLLMPHVGSPNRPSPIKHPVRSGDGGA
jgi:hypothetical protein